MNYYIPRNIIVIILNTTTICRKNVIDVNGSLYSLTLVMFYQASRYMYFHLFGWWGPFSIQFKIRGRGPLWRVHEGLFLSGFLLFRTR